MGIKFIKAKKNLIEELSQNSETVFFFCWMEGAHLILENPESRHTNIAVCQENDCSTKFKIIAMDLYT